MGILKSNSKMEVVANAAASFFSQRVRFAHNSISQFLRACLRDINMAIYRKGGVYVRTKINIDEIKPGFKAFVWEGYCMKVDNLRRELIPGYDPMKLSEEEQMRDWYNFEKYYDSKYGKKAM